MRFSFHRPTWLHAFVLLTEAMLSGRGNTRPNTRGADLGDLPTETGSRRRWVLQSRGDGGVVGDCLAIEAMVPLTYLVWRDKDCSWDFECRCAANP